MNEVSSTCASLSVSTTLCGNNTVHRRTRWQRQHPSTEHRSSTLVVTTLERAFNLDSCVICLFLSKDSELRTGCSELCTECRKVQISQSAIGRPRSCRFEADTITP